MLGLLTLKQAQFSALLHIIRKCSHGRNVQNPVVWNFGQQAGVQGIVAKAHVSVRQQLLHCHAATPHAQLVIFQSGKPSQW